MSSVRTGERLAGVAGMVLIAVMFGEWWHAGAGVSDAARSLGLGIDTTFDAFEATDFLDLIWAVTALTGILLGVVAFGGSRPSPGLRMATTALGAASVVTIAYRILDAPLGASPRYGVFVGLIAAAGVGYGGYMSVKDGATDG